MSLASCFVGLHRFGGLRKVLSQADAEDIRARDGMDLNKRPGDWNGPFIPGADR